MAALTVSGIRQGDCANAKQVIDLVCNICHHVEHWPKTNLVLATAHYRLSTSSHLLAARHERRMKNFPPSGDEIAAAYHRGTMKQWVLAAFCPLSPYLVLMPWNPWYNASYGDYFRSVFSYGRASHLQILGAPGHLIDLKLGLKTGRIQDNGCY